ncbi:hypothetical protein KIN20_036590 [Parelaphostrongylus tenuis]|uniref:Uncharacterized protein n=1 Tax=Parelaphostrongylus tenuis TaxID=148309 RepID=A0AAD5RD84_PARTN|nr:hypothetical protein KIN20_036590 [Parelaphostrongylus tenuis]
MAKYIRRDIVKLSLEGTMAMLSPKVSNLEKKWQVLTEALMSSTANMELNRVFCVKDAIDSVRAGCTPTYEAITLGTLRSSVN